MERGTAGQTELVWRQPSADGTEKFLGVHPALEISQMSGMDMGNN
jgi:hypothetical protein